MSDIVGKLNGRSWRDYTNWPKENEQIDREAVFEIERLRAVLWLANETLIRIGGRLPMDQYVYSEKVRTIIRAALETGK